MTLPLPSLEEPEPGTSCPRCQEPVRLAAPIFCASCFEQSLQARERAIAADYAEARKRARTWQLARVVQS
jgi:predicted amidophosphoribosyltransferase